MNAGRASFLPGQPRNGGLSLKLSGGMKVRLFNLWDALPIVPPPRVSFRLSLRPRYCNIAVSGRRMGNCGVGELARNRLHAGEIDSLELRMERQSIGLISVHFRISGIVQQKPEQIQRESVRCMSISLPNLLYWYLQSLHAALGKRRINGLSYCPVGRFF